jgi:nucleoid-associated protein YgaU
MGLEKATIEVIDGADAGKKIPVLFNPAEYTIERANTFKASAIPGLSGPLIQFVNGEADVLSMELFLDDFTDPSPGGKSVRERIDEIAGLLEIDRELHAPPHVRFVWGRLTFKAIFEKMSRKITLFQPDGIPARATLNVSFKEYKTLPELVNEPRLQSADKHKRRVIVGSNELWQIAAREYHDAALWRVIADRNDLDDPRAVSAGDWVLVPPLDATHGSRGAV